MIDGISLNSRATKSLQVPNWIWEREEEQSKIIPGK